MRFISVLFCVLCLSSTALAAQSFPESWSDTQIRLDAFSQDIAAFDGECGKVQKRFDTTGFLFTEFSVYEFKSLVKYKRDVAEASYGKANSSLAELELRQLEIREQCFKLLGRGRTLVTDFLLLAGYYDTENPERSQLARQGASRAKELLIKAWERLIMIKFLENVCQREQEALDWLEKALAGNSPS